MTKPYRSKAIRNLKSAANSTVRTTGKYASKGICKTAKWMATDHTNAFERCSIMELEQKLNYSRAAMDLALRRSNAVGKSGLVTDYLEYLWDLFWGFIMPIVSYLLMTIFMIVLIVVFNVIFFYALFWLLFS
jgi:hypothetical protein